MPRESSTIVDLSAGKGRIWSSGKATALSSGLVATFANRFARLGSEDERSDAVLVSLFTNAGFDYRGSTLAAVDGRGNVFMVYIAQNRYSHVTRGGTGGTAIAFGNERRPTDVVVGFANNLMCSFHTVSGKLISTLKGHRSPVRHVSFHPSGAFAVSTSLDVVLLWDLKEWTRKRALAGGSAGVVQAGFNPSGDLMITLFKDDTFLMWEFGSFSLAGMMSVPNHASLPTTKPGFSSFSISFDGKLLVSCGKSPLLFVWDVKRRALLRTIRMVSSVTSVSQVHFLPDGKTVSATCDDGIIRFVDIVTSHLMFDISAQPQGAILSASIDPLGKHCACILNDGTLQLFDLEVAKLNNPTDTEPEKAAEADFSGAFPVHRETAIDDVVPWESVGDSQPLAPASELLNSPLAHSGAATQNSNFLRRSIRKPTLQSSSKKAKTGGLDKEPQFEKWATSVRKKKVPDPEEEERAQELLRNVLTSDRLKKQLAAYGQYPDKYRVTIWQFLLRLPLNREAFDTLVQRGPHRSMNDIERRFPVADRRLATRLYRILSAIAHWAPVLGDVSYLPALVYPFVRLFDHNDLVCFEVIVTVILNWCRRWLEHYPNPPINVINAVDSLLELHDRKLHEHFRKLNVGAQTYIWLPLQTLLSKLVSESDWLILWDNCVTQSPAFLLFVFVSFLKHFHSTLIGIDNQKDLEHFLLQRSNPVNLRQVMQKAYQLMENTGAEHQPGVCAPFQPLPQGQYPLYNEYPKFVADYQMAERERIRQDEEDLLRRRNVLEELRKRVNELQSQENDWKKRQEEILKAEEERRISAAGEEDVRFKEKQRLDDMMKQQRLQQISAMEESCRTFMDSTTRLREAEVERLNAEIERRKRLEDYELQSRIETEGLLSVEMAAAQRMRAMHQERDREAAAQELKTIVDAHTKEAELKIKAMEEQRKIEDDERRLRLQMSEEEREKAKLVEDMVRSRKEVDAKFRTDDLERDMKELQIERDRRLRQLTEDHMLRLDQSLKIREREEDALRREEDAHFRTVISADKEERIKTGEERQRIIDRERQKHALELAMREERLRRLEREQKIREFEQTYSEKRRDETEKVMEEERELQRVLLTVEDERRRDALLEQELSLKDKALQDKLAFQRQAMEREQEAIQEERRKFDRIREQLRVRLAEEEADMVRRHETIMAQLVVDRERRMSDGVKQAKQRTQQDEMERTRLERRQHDVAQSNMESRLVAEEESLRRHQVQQPQTDTSTVTTTTTNTDQTPNRTRTTSTSRRSRNTLTSSQTRSSVTASSRDTEEGEGGPSVTASASSNLTGAESLASVGDLIAQVRRDLGANESGYLTTSSEYPPSTSTQSQTAAATSNSTYPSAAAQEHASSFGRSPPRQLPPESSYDGDASLDASSTMSSSSPGRYHSSPSVVTRPSGPLTPIAEASSTAELGSSIRSSVANDSFEPSVSSMTTSTTTAYMPTYTNTTYPGMQQIHLSPQPHLPHSSTSQTTLHHHHHQQQQQPQGATSLSQASSSYYNRYQQQGGGGSSYPSQSSDYQAQGSTTLSQASSYQPTYLSQDSPHQHQGNTYPPQDSATSTYHPQALSQTSTTYLSQDSSQRPQALSQTSTYHQQQQVSLPSRPRPRTATSPVASLSGMSSSSASTLGLPAERNLIRTISAQLAGQQPPPPLDEYEPPVISGDRVSSMDLRRDAQAVTQRLRSSYSPRGASRDEELAVAAVAAVMASESESSAAYNDLPLSASQHLGGASSVRTSQQSDLDMSTSRISSSFPFHTGTRYSSGTDTTATTRYHRSSASSMDSFVTTGSQRRKEIADLESEVQRLHDIITRIG